MSQIMRDIAMKIGASSGLTEDEKSVLFMFLSHSSGATAFTAGIQKGMSDIDASEIKARKVIAKRINISDIPTSSTGLESGEVWNDAGTLKIVS